MQANISDMPLDQKFFFYLQKWVFRDDTHIQTNRPTDIATLGLNQPKG